jgi:hypothetical protein
MVQVCAVWQDDLGYEPAVAVSISRNHCDILLMRQLARELPGAGSERLSFLRRIDPVEPDANLPVIAKDDEGVGVGDGQNAGGELLGAEHRGERQENDKHFHL